MNGKLRGEPQQQATRGGRENISHGRHIGEKKWIPGSKDTLNLKHPGNLGHRKKKTKSKNNMNKEKRRNRE